MITRRALLRALALAVLTPRQMVYLRKRHRYQAAYPRTY